MRLTAIIVILMSLSILTAMSLEEYQTSASGVTASLREFRAAPLIEDDDPNNNDNSDTISFVSKTFALPYESVSVQVHGMRWNVFDENGNFLYIEDSFRNDTAVLAKSFTFREMRGFTVKIRAQFEEGNTIRTLHSLDFDIVGQSPIQTPQSVSPAFVQAYASLADNWDTCYLRNLPMGRPRMLIVSHDPLGSYQQDFINWKRQRGFIIDVLNKSQIGSSLDDFKAAIAAHYLEFHNDYVLLFGDVTGTYSIPTAFYPNPEYAQENDADDHQYTLVVGDDYFPEMLIGRFSFNNISELATMMNKTVAYEKTPFMDDPSWMRKALTIAGNFAEGNLRPTTPIHMSRMLRDRFLDFGYTQVDTVYYPPTYPGTSLIQTAINQGLQIISYRGWGDANGWHYPSFHLADLNGTFNGPRMPIVYSIVCNTGDFANPVNPSFGERWMRMGSMTTPGGCIAFVGPSDLHTKTRYNNSISTGAFRSILDYGVRGFGSSVLEGKIELYKNFPNDLGDNQYVKFYYHVYNLLSDPSLNMWILEPDPIPESVFMNGLSFSQTDTHIQIDPALLDGATITGTKDGSTYSYLVVQDGHAILPIDPMQEGDLIVTITKENMVPIQRTLTATAAHDLSVTQTELILSESSDLHHIDATVRNNTEGSISNVSLHLSAFRPDLVSITEPTVEIGTLNPGQTMTSAFGISFDPQIRYDLPVVLKLEVKENDTVVSTHLATVKAPNAQLVVLSHTGTLPLGQNSPISFEIQNTGNRAIVNQDLSIYSLTSIATASASPSNISNLAPGETTTINTTINVSNDTYDGRIIRLSFRINGSDALFVSPYYAVEAGTPSNNDPTGPCAYGYYAYDSFDLGYSPTPVYDWIEIDPLLGGEAEVFINMDDGSRTVDLPFSFRFYGVDYNQITICSNGWMSFGETDMFDFYNHYIPAALGPSAMIAGYWDDLKGMRTGTDEFGNGIFNDMRMLYWYDQANNRYIVQWNDAYNQYNIDLYEDASLEKFQIILYPNETTDGDIVVQYHTVDNPGTTTNYCTVGIEDHLQLDGLSYTHGNQYPITATPLQAGLAIKFTTTAPDNAVSNDNNVVVPSFELGQNYPNPFNPTTTISFNSPIPGEAKLEILNLRGQVVKTLVNGPVASGKHQYVWNGTDESNQASASGIYFYRLTMNGKTESRRMLMVK